MSNSIHSDTSNTVRVSPRRFDMSPFHECYVQAGLGSFVDLDKKDYIGREALLEVDQRVLLMGLKCASVPASGGEVFAGSIAVGHVTTAAWSPTLECGLSSFTKSDQSNQSRTE
jgi:glycine cleavage system aminomethyltransferase T